MYKIKKKRSFGTTVLITIIMMMIFENVIRDFLFFLSPSTNYLIKDIYSGICLVIVMVLLLQNKIRIYSDVSKVFYLFVFFQCLILPIYSGIIAYLDYGQPIIYGILAERARMISISALLIYYFLTKGLITLKELNSIIIKLAWVCLFSYLGIRVLYEIVPSIFQQDLDVFEKGLSIIDSRTIETKGGIVMRVGLALLVYSSIYYFVSYLKTKNLKNILYLSAFFLFIIIFNKGRGVIAYTSLTLIIAYFNIATLRGKLISLGIGVLLIFGFLFNGIQLNQNEQSPSFLTSYINIFEGITQAKKGNTSSEDMEASTWARVYSLSVVGTSFDESSLNWIFGTGRLSNQYENGFSAKYSQYFYPEDIGVIGALFLYGIIVLLGYKFIFLRIYKHLRNEYRDDIYIKAMRYFALYFFISSIQTGADIMGNPEILTLLFCFGAFCHFKNNQFKTDSFANLPRLI